MELGDLQGVKAIIKSLVLSCPRPNEMTLDKLARDYNAEERHPIPFRKLGFQSLESFLCTISDTVRVYGGGPSAIVRIVPSDKSGHIQQMIAEQKKPPRVKGRIRSKKPQEHFPAAMQHLDYPSQTQKSRKPWLYSTPKPLQQQQQRRLPDHHYADESGTSTHVRLTHAIPRNPQKNTTTKCGVYNMSETKTQIMSKYIRSGVEMNKIPAVPKAAQMPYMRVPTNSEYRLTSDQTFHTKTTYSMANPLATEIGANNSYELEINKIESAFRKSVSLVETKEAQQENETNQHTLVDSSISSSTKSAKQSLIDALLSTKLYEESIDDGSHISDEAVPESALNDLVYRLDFPENTVVFGVKISTYNIPKYVKRGTTAAIFISEIHNPYKFWFHFWKENHELDGLMNDIGHFYMSLDPEEFRIPRTCIIPGQICAALFKNMWYRAEVLSPVINGKAKVLYMDYGTVVEIHFENIKYLVTKFAQTPSQAMRGSLSHIKPRGLHWTPEATECFLSMVFEMPIYAQVSEIDEENRVFHFVLCNTVDHVDLQVNKALVENGFALYDEEWQEGRIKRTGQRWRHPRETFPTFTMLESGAYPALAELVQLQKLGIDYEAIIDKHIFHPGKLNDIENAPAFLRNLPFKLLSTNPFRMDIALQLNRLM